MAERTLLLPIKSNKIDEGMHLAVRPHAFLHLQSQKRCFECALGWETQDTWLPDRAAR